MPQGVKIAGHPFLSSTEHAVIRGERVAHVLTDLKKKGLRPDVIFAHSGWGESFYIKDVFPNTRLINYCEFSTRPRGAILASIPSSLTPRSALGISEPAMPSSS